MKRFRPALTCAVALLLAASPVLAQDPVEDWDLHQVPRERTLMASIEYDGGVSVGVRCTGENLEVMIAGLPEASRREPLRTLDYAFGDAPMRSSTWWVGERGGRDVIFANFPAGMARQLREGGDLHLRTPARNGDPARRNVVPIPPSPAAINQVLTACNRPLEDRRDTLRSDEASATPGGLRWSEPPSPDYPDKALRAGIPAGVAVISCLTTAEGRAEACQIEAEWPGNYDFGRAALRGTRSARLEGTEGRVIQDGGVIVFTSTFRMR